MKRDELLARAKARSLLEHDRRLASYAWEERYRSLRWWNLRPGWEQILACAQGRDRKRGYESTRNYNPDHHLLGVCGEVLYSIESKAPMNWQVDDARGDGGVVDFPGGIQVKAVSYEPERWVRGQYSLVEFADARAWAPFYVLTLVALPEQAGAVIGWERGDRLRVAPIVDFGHGERRAISAVDLHPGIPDIA